ncbi:uncharacterized protein ZBAI_01949 [Zygosaccharomyces bailii ISA1307]|nr:uncharacterized protein ZBAI_01949 [Zygosaccharomyces bailii ISA1307]
MSFAKTSVNKLDERRNSPIYWTILVTLLSEGLLVTALQEFFFFFKLAANTSSEPLPLVLPWHFTRKQRSLFNVMFGIHSRRARTAQEMSLERGNCVFPVSHVHANVPYYRGSFPYKFEQLAMQVGVRFRSSKADYHVEDHGQTS